MEKQIGPIPAFYACYLLRSIARHASLYVGSTPNPPRRLRQHNGHAKGGAVRTSRDSLRPWEMTCLVTGFPSKIAALQFEWAWQNPNLTRHIAPELRITQSNMTARISPRSGKTRKRSARPRLSLSDRLANLHLLLRAKSFSRWPLKLTFFCEDVHRVWQKMISQTLGRLRPGIQVIMDDSCRSLPIRQDDKTPSLTAIGIHALQLDYSGLKLLLEKTRSVFDGKQGQKCNICHQAVPDSGAATLACTNHGCHALSHLRCLSSSFLAAESNRSCLVPTQGDCPSCGTQLQWVDLVKELSLRMRGEREMKALFKQKRGKKAAKTAINNDHEDEDADEQDDDDAQSSADSDGPLEMVLNEDDEWNVLSESSSDEAMKKKIRSSSTPGPTVVKRALPKTTAFHTIAEEDNWENAPIVT